MRIKNNRNIANYVNYKSNGIANKISISAGKIVDILAISNESQIINFGDFKRGFFEILENNLIEEKINLIKDEVVDSLTKVKEEVKKYTENKRK